MRVKWWRKTREGSCEIGQRREEEGEGAGEAEVGGEGKDARCWVCVRGGMKLRGCVMKMRGDRGRSRGWEARGSGEGKRKE